MGMVAVPPEYLIFLHVHGEAFRGHCCSRITSAPFIAGGMYNSLHQSNDGLPGLRTGSRTLDPPEVKPTKGTPHGHPGPLHKGVSGAQGGTPPDHKYLKAVERGT